MILLKKQKEINDTHTHRHCTTTTTTTTTTTSNNNDKIPVTRLIIKRIGMKIIRRTIIITI